MKFFEKKPDTAETLTKERWETERDHARKEIKKLTNTVYVLAGALLLSFVSDSADALKDPMNKSLGSANRNLIRMVISEQAHNRTLTADQAEMVAEILALKIDLQTAQEELEADKELMEADATIRAKNNAYIKSLEERILELEKQMKEAGINVMPTDFDALDAATADVKAEEE